MKRDRLVDHIGSTTSLVFAALPEFVIGIVLVLVFATQVFKVLPAVSLIPPGDHAWQHLNVVILPAATLVLAVTPYISRIMRGSMIEVLESDYVTMARLKGLPGAHGDLAPRGPQRDRPGDPGLCPAARLDGRRRRRRRVRVLLPGRSGPRSSTPWATGTFRPCRRSTLIIAAVYVVLNVAADVTTILVTPRLRTAGR